MQLQFEKQKMEQPAKKSSSHCTAIQAGIGATSTTPTSVVTNTPTVFMITPTSHPDYILEDYIDSEGDVLVL